MNPLTHVQMLVYSSQPHVLPVPHCWARSLKLLIIAVSLIILLPASALASDGMTFVSDVTIPDGTGISAGSSFSQTWRSQNSGTTTRSNYAAVSIPSTTTGGPSINLNSGAAASVAAPFASPGTFTLSNNAPICDTNPPIAPAVRLNWTASSGATSYDLFRNGSLYSSGITGTTFYNSANVVAGQTYTYFVRARNSSGSTDSNTISVFIPSNICSLAAPTISSISPSNVIVNQVTVLTVNGSNFQSGFSAAVTTSLGTFSIASAGLTFVNSSQVRVQVTMGGTPPLSATLRITNPDGQSATGTFQVVSSTPGPFTLSNNAPVCDTAQPIAPAVRLNWTASNGATSYDLFRNGSLYNSGLTSTTFYNNANVVAGQTYTYFVRAKNVSGSTDSNTISVFIPSNICALPGPSISGISPSNVPVNQVTVLTVNGSNFQSGFSASVTTSLGTFNIASAGLTFSSSSQVFVQVTMGGTPPLSATLRITNPDGQSATGVFQVVSSTPVPGTFTLSNNTPICDTNPPAAPAIRLNWTTSSNATSYDVFRNGSLYSSGVTGTTFYNNANLIAGQTYTYFVRAHNSAGSTDSNTVTVLIPSNICPSTSPPTINSISPSNVIVNQVTVLTVNGSNFQSGFGATVTTSLGTFSIAGAGLTFISSSQVLVQVTMGGTPPLSATLKIINPDGQSATGNFQVVASSTTGAFTLSNQVPVCDTNAPVAPAVRLNWTASSGATSYDLYRNGNIYSSGLTGTTFYNSANVVAGQTYTYFVRARNSSGSTDSNTITVVVPANICTSTISPPAISSINPSSVTVNQVTVLTVNGSNFQNGFSATVTTSLGTFSIAGAGLTFVSSSQVLVQVTMGGTPPLSATLRIINPDGQSATGIFQVTSQQATPGAFTLSSQAPVCDTNPPVTPAVRLNWTASNGAASYDLNRNGAPYSTGITGTTFYNSANLVAGQTYTYSVRAKNSAGTTDSNTVTVIVPSNICSSTVLPPIIDRITPSTVTVNQITTLTVTGSNFQSNFSVNVQGNPIDPSGLRFISSNEVSVSVKMGGTPPYPATLVLTNVADGRSASGTFTVAAVTNTPLTPTASFTYSPASPLAGQSVQFTDASSGQALSWEWDFNGDGATDSRLPNPTHTFTSPGPQQVTLRVTNAYGTDSITKSINVGTSAAGTPVITDVIRKYSGFFLKGSGFDNVFDVRVNWNGSPGSVALTIDGGSPIVQQGGAGGASFTLNLDRNFSPKFSASVVKITPTNGAGITGNSVTKYVYVFPYPSWLETTIGTDSSALHFTASGGQINADLHFDFPEPHLAQDGPIDIPSWVPYIGGKFGLEETYAQVGGTISSSGSGSIRLGGQTGFTAAGQSLRGSVFGSGSFLLNESGLSLKSTSFNLGLSGTLSKEVGIIDAIPQLATFKTTPFIGTPLRWFNEKAKLIGEVSPSLQFGANWEQDLTGALKFNDATGTLGLKLTGTLKVQPIDHLRATGSVSGGGSFTVGVPGRFVRGANITFEAGVKLEIEHFFKALEAKATYHCTWSAGSAVDCGPGGASSQVVRPIQAATFLPEDLPLTLIQPNYERFGTYSAFYASRRASKASNSVIPTSVAQSTLVSNVFQGAAPKIIGVGPGALLLWAQQDSSLPVLQSTDIAWSYNPGGDAWTQPGLIAHDTRAELSPTAGVDGNGKVVAAWLRVKDTNFVTPINSTSDLPLFYDRFDVVSATFDPLSGAWGPVTALTDDTAMDTSLRLASDSAGHLLLTWLSNPAGEFTSTATSPSSLKYSFYNGSSWGTPAAIGSNLAGVSSNAPAVRGSEAFVIVPREPDPSAPGAGVLDLYKWNGTTWSAPSAFAGGGVDNRLPSTVYTSDGEGHVVWLRGNDLVHATLSNPTPQVVRSGSTSMAFYNVQLCTNPQGNLTLTWQEAVDNGPANIVAMLYDPVTQTWSADRRLSADQSLAHDVSGYYGSDGQLHLAYLATQISRTTETVVIDGTPLTVSNVPQEGRSDLLLLSHSLINDLAVTDSDLTVNSLSLSQGETVSADLDVHNAGDFAIGNFVVNLYVGDPASGGALVGSATVADLLRAGDHRMIPFTFTMPAGGGNIIAVVDANNSVSEFTKSNNRATFYLNNTAPHARISASVTGGTAPLALDLDASGSFDTEGEAMTFAWAFADGSPSVGGAKVSHTFSQPGVYAVTVSVTDTHGAVGTAVLTVTVNPARAAQFNTAFYDVAKDGGSVVVTVTRSGDVSGSAAVDYQTVDGTASSRSDYTTAIGTLNFAPGETTKTFTVFITDNAFVSGPETLYVLLSNPKGIGLGFPSAALITISGNESASQGNPIDSAEFFVRQHYRDFLNRDPDAPGLAFWTNEITSCGSNTSCLAVKKINVSAAFFLSIEFQQTGYLVYRMHQAAFGTGERLPLNTFLKDTQEIGRGVVVNAPGWEQQLEANKQAFVGSFVARSEFTSLYPQAMTPDQFVDALNLNTGNSLTQGERDQLVSQLAASGNSAQGRAQVLRSVAENAAFSSRESNKAFVLMQYFGYLRRSPNDLPDHDFSGWQFWLSKLNQFNGNFVQAEMVKAFISSDEYRKRFGQ